MKKMMLIVALAVAATAAIAQVKQGRTVLTCTKTTNGITDTLTVTELKDDEVVLTYDEKQEDYFVRFNDVMVSGQEINSNDIYGGTWFLETAKNSEGKKYEPEIHQCPLGLLISYLTEEEGYNVKVTWIPLEKK